VRGAITDYFPQMFPRHGVGRLSSLLAGLSPRNRAFLARGVRAYRCPVTGGTQLTRLKDLVTERRSAAFSIPFCKRKIVNLLRSLVHPLLNAAPR
jgi:hypothetical protein